MFAELLLWAQMCSYRILGVFQRRDEMLGLGVVGTVIVIVVIVWLIRRV